MSNINNRVFGQNVDPKIIKQFDRLQRGRFNTNPNQELRPEDDFKDYMPSLKKGESSDLKQLTPQRLKWCLDNELITSI